MVTVIDIEGKFDIRREPASQPAKECLPMKRMNAIKERTHPNIFYSQPRHPHTRKSIDNRNNVS